MFAAARVSALCVAAVGLACGGSTRATLPPPPDPDVGPVLLGSESFHVPGEVLVWRVKWKGILGGTTSLVVGEPGVLDGHEAIIVRSETRGDGLVAVFRHVRDELTTMIDLERGVPIKAEAVVEKGRSVRFVEAVFSDRGYRVTRRYGGSEPAKWEQSVPEGARAHDLHSTMAHVRLWDPEPGTRAYLYAQSGESFYRIDVVAAGVETLRTELGEVAARRVEGTATPYDRNGEPKAGADLRTFMAWFSTDEARVPLRIVADTTYGKVYAELANYQQPAGKALRLDHTSPAPAPD